MHEAEGRGAMANRSLLLIAHGSSHQGNVEETVHRHAAALQLEVTESLTAQDENARARLRELKALGLRTGIDSLRRGMVMMGYESIKRWLSDQLPHSCTEPNMQPIRESMVMRARLTTLLLNPGVENELRREIYLCALLSQMDELLREPLGTILRRIPLSERIYDATVLHTGPYAPSLQMACALEHDDASVIRRQIGRAHV